MKNINSLRSMTEPETRKANGGCIASFIITVPILVTGFSWNLVQKLFKTQ